MHIDTNFIFVNTLLQTIENSTLLNVANRNLDVVTELYNHLTHIVPTLVLANQYFNGIIEYGVIAQVRGAFWHILKQVYCEVSCTVLHCFLFSNLSFSYVYSSQ